MTNKKRKVKILSTPQMKNGGVALQQDATQVQGDILPLSQSFGEVQGQPHSKGGTPILANGTPIEAERNEPVSTNLQGDVVFWGKMTNPLTGRLFKNDAKTLAKEENLMAQQLNKGEDLIANNNPDTMTGLLSYSSGIVKQDAARQKEAAILKKKETYGDAQQMILDYSQSQGIKPQDFSKALSGKTVPKMKDGGTISKMADGGKVKTKDYWVASARLAAMKYGVDPEVIERLIEQESGFNPKAESKAGAKGIGQFKPGTAKQYGLEPSKLTSTKTEDVEAQIDAVAKHFKDLQDQFNGDPILAAASYNGGPGWSDSPTYQKGKDGPVATAAKYLGIPRSEMTGGKLMEYYADKATNRPSDQPSAFVNENRNYINNIFNLDDKEFYGSGDTPGVSQAYREEFYSSPEAPPTTPPVAPPTSFLPGEPQPLVAGSQRPPGDIGNQVDPSTINRNSHIPANDFLTRNVTPTTETVQQPQQTPADLLGSLADRNKLGITDFLPEIGAILDTPDYVPGQQFTPDLYQPYQVSFQDRVNQNQANFNQIAALSNNPGAMATLAGQLYGANQQVLADEFRTNQGIANQVTNQNVSLLNQAQQTNLQLQDQQMVRQAQAKANTDLNRQNALSNLSSKYAQNKADRNLQRMGEGLFNFRLDEDLKLQNQNPVADFKYDPQTGAALTPQDKEAMKLQQQQYKLEQEKLKTYNQQQKNKNFLIKSLNKIGK